MKFEIGKFYRHNGGGVMHILTEVVNCTGYSSPALIAENPAEANFEAIGRDEAAAVNWIEIPSKEYYAVWYAANPDSRELRRLANGASFTEA